MFELRILFFLFLITLLTVVVRKLWNSPKFDNFCNGFFRKKECPKTTDEVIEEVKLVNESVKEKEEALIEEHKRIKADAERLSKVRKVVKTKDVRNGKIV